MAPQQESVGWPLEESEAVLEDKGVINALPRSATEREVRIVWTTLIPIFSGHVLAVYGVYLFFTQALWATRFFSIAWYIISLLGVTVGAHRLWSHKSFKARSPLRVLLVMFFCCSGQGHLFSWARDHRTHHKFSGTDADPYNASRGFFFSHMGWLCVRKHPEVNAKADTIRHDDLYADPLVQLQKKYFLVMMPFFCFVLPSCLPTLWGESLWTAIFVNAFRLVCLFNATGLVNSVTHMWGDRPYDQNLQAVEFKSLSFFVLGEGFHNFHHAFPWDYKTGELGGYSLNIAKLFIDIMAKIGWAYDLKSVSQDIIEKRVKRTGDGSHHLWGWDDASADDKKVATIENPDKNE